MLPILFQPKRPSIFPNYSHVKSQRNLSKVELDLLRVEKYDWIKPDPQNTVKLKYDITENGKANNETDRQPLLFYIVKRQRRI